MVPQRLQLSGVYLPLAVAGWFHLPELWNGGRGVVNVSGPISMPQLSARNITDGRHNIRRHPEAASHVVSRHVVRDEPKERRQRLRLAAGARDWEVTKQPGRGSISCVGRWFGPAGIV